MDIVHNFLPGLNSHLVNIPPGAFICTWDKIITIAALCFVVGYFLSDLFTYIKNKKTNKKAPEAK